ncbi:acetoin utilization protein AcuC [Kineococcus xinjiangensis]
MSPVRLDLTARLCVSLGLFDDPQVSVVTSRPAPDELLETVHEAEYIAAVRRASEDPVCAEERYGLGTDDDPAFRGMHEAGARIVGASTDLALAVWRGRCLHGVNFCGGMHHAMPGYASGFCVYNDAAVAIRALLDEGARRVAYVDTDVHHGDGPQAVFWDDPRVLTVSVHESGRTLFPGTGYPDEVGGRGAEGTAVNVALPAGVADAGWLRAVHAVVPPLLRSFEPDVLITQHGCDTHSLDPLGHLVVSVDAQRQVARTLHELAHEVAGGRWVALGGGGYAIVDVVPRAWAHLVAEVAHRPLEPATPVPAEWRRHVETLTGRSAPARMTDGEPAHWDGWESGFDPADAVDRAILATRNAVFPFLGLDPLFD